MEYERLVGIDFGTSTSIIRTKIYDNNGKPDGQKLSAQSVVFNNGSSMSPTIIRQKEDTFLFGYDAEVPSRNSEVFRSFKIDLQSDDKEKCDRAKILTKKYFEYLYGEYKHQQITGYLGNTEANDLTLVSYPVKWENATRNFMLEAAKSAGFENVVGMDEAEAAIDAITVQCQDVLKKEGFLLDGIPSNILLIDMGAGTTDIVVCKYTPGTDSSNEILTTWPKDGNILFGGQEMDIVLKDYIVSKFPLEYREQIKSKITIDKIKAWKENTVSRSLKQNRTVSEFGEAENIASFMDIDFEEFALDREELESLFKDYITQFVKLVAGAIIDSGLRPDDIDLIILTGGHSKWYFIDEILSGKTTKFGNLNFKKIVENPNRIMSVALPQETVALGLVYSKLSGKLVFDKSEHLWKTYLETKSMTALEEAAELGAPEAENELAFLYGTGNGMPKNTDKAIELYKLASEKGNTQAFYNLGCCYFELKNFGEAFSNFEEAAKRDFPEALNNLGVCYFYGFGVEKNLDVALEKFKRAFDLGYIPAKEKYQKLLKKAYPDQEFEIDDYDGNDVLEYCKYISSFSLYNFYIGEDIPQQKIGNFLSSFVNADIINHKYLCYYDDTLFGGGRDGFLLTDRCMCWHSFLGTPMCVNIDEIAGFSVSNANTLVISLKNGMSSVVPSSNSNYKNQIAAFLSKVTDFIMNHNEVQ